MRQPWRSLLTENIVPAYPEPLPQRKGQRRGAAVPRREFLQRAECGIVI